MGLPHYLPKQLCQDSSCPFPILFGQLSPECLESVSFLATHSPIQGIQAVCSECVRTRKQLEHVRIRSSGQIRMLFLTRSRSLGKVSRAISLVTNIQSTEALRSSASKHGG